jgi:hypothetical protein
MRSMLSEAKSRRRDRSRGTRRTDSKAGFAVLIEATKHCSLGQLTGASPEREPKDEVGGSIGGICRHVRH